MTVFPLDHRKRVRKFQMNRCSLMIVPMRSIICPSSALLIEDSSHKMYASYRSSTSFLNSWNHALVCCRTNWYVKFNVLVAFRYLKLPPVPPLGVRQERTGGELYFPNRSCSFGKVIWGHIIGFARYYPFL